MTKQNNTERLGINAAEKVFLDMNWLFREQPVSDFGIDAHAEPIDENRPTGQLIGLQIKSGKSYFKKRGENYVYYGEERHLSYWKNHILPVFIILHNPITDLTIWQKIEDQLITHHRNGNWSIEIPASQILDKQAGDYLKHGISSDPASIRRFRLELDLPLIKEIAEHACKEGAFLTLGEWVNKTLNFREAELRFGDPDAEPKYNFMTWMPSGELNEVMAHFFPWLNYEYAREIDNSSGEVESHDLSIEINELGHAILAVEDYILHGAESQDIEPWYEDNTDSLASRFGPDEDW